MKLDIRNTANLINPTTKLSILIYAPPKFGKTTLAATLNKVTLAENGKKTLFIAVEAGEGGGTMSIQHAAVDYVAPTSYEEFLQVLAALQNDTTYGGVVLDSATEYVNRFLKPYALRFAPRERVDTRQAGVPTRSDYQTMGEKARIDFLQLIGMTIHRNPDCRKHLVVTALQREKTDDSGRLIAIQPELPGSMSATATAMFQTVGQIIIKSRVVDNVRTQQRILLTEGDGVRVVGDRTGVFPAEAPPDLKEIWDKYWLPKIKETSNA